MILTAESLISKADCEHDPVHTKNSYFQSKVRQTFQKFMQIKTFY